MAEDLVCSLSDLKEQQVLQIVRERLEAGDNPFDILEEASRAMKIVGERFAAQEYFLPDLMYAGELLRQVTEIITPFLNEPAARKNYLGKIVLGTVAGDIHNIGKDIVAFTLNVNGFEVFDLGVDVPAAQFVDKIREVKPDIVGLSGLLTVAFGAMKETVDAIKAAGLREGVKIMIGGSQVDEQVMNNAGADAYCLDAMAGVYYAKQWVGVRDGKNA